MKTKAITYLILPVVIIAMSGFLRPGAKHKATFAKQNNQTLKDTSAKYFPITLKAFVNAQALKPRYDSIAWFGHIKGKTYFYTVKGKWNMYLALWNINDVPRNYKMGLVGPDLKEIIPPEFDLIRNIGGTFPGLVEVEKDHKRGFYNLAGKLIISVQYDQVFPVDSNNSKAVLRKGHDFYWFKNNYTISGKANLNIKQVFSMLKLSLPLSTENDITGNVIELNSRKEDVSIYLPPSHLTDLNLLTHSMFFRKPLRKNISYWISTPPYNVKKISIAEPEKEDHNNWFKSILYSITEHFVFGRTEFYNSKKLVLVDQKRNQVYGKNVSIDYSQGEGFERGSPYRCDDYSVRALNDSLIEVKVSALINISFYNDDHLVEMPVYHYFTLKNNNIAELKSNRLFSFTQYVKMDDRYLNGCYAYTLHPDSVTWKTKQTDCLSTEALVYLKNEIYASYHYKFKDQKWNDIFQKNSFFRFLNPGTESRDNVDDLLTPIDKYNIQWIDQKLKNAPVQTQIASN